MTNWKKPRCTEKKFRCTGTEIFLRFETELDLSRPWFSEIKVCFKPYKNFSSCTPELFFSAPDFFFSLSPEFFSGLWYKSEKNPVDKLKKNSSLLKKKCRCAGPEIFLRFETELDFSRPWFSEMKVQIKWLSEFVHSQDHFAVTKISWSGITIAALSARPIKRLICAERADKKRACLASIQMGKWTLQIDWMIFLVCI